MISDRWSGCDSTLQESGLPSDKQFLITERVPCSRRISDLDKAGEDVEQLEIDDDWTELKTQDN